MPLQPLALEIVRISETGLTPALIISDQFSLRNVFFVELFGAVDRATPLPVRLDWVDFDSPGWSNLLVGFWVRHRVRSICRAIEAQQSPSVTDDEPVRRSVSVIRPQRQRDRLAFSVCPASIELPEWASAIRLGWSGEQTNLQLG